LQDHLLKAKEELEDLDSELNKAMTQQLILRKRQADLGNYMQEALKKVSTKRLTGYVRLGGQAGPYSLGWKE
jgi:hypothetical protein